MRTNEIDDYLSARDRVVARQALEDAAEDLIGPYIRPVKVDRNSYPQVRAEIIHELAGRLKDIALGYTEEADD